MSEYEGAIQREFYVFGGPSELKFIWLLKMSF